MIPDSSKGRGARRHGQTVRALIAKSGGYWFKSHPDHYVDFFFSVVPNSTTRVIVRLLSSNRLVFLTLLYFILVFTKSVDSNFRAF